MTDLEKGCELEAAAAFDTTYTTNHIRILKALLPFFGSREKNGMAVLIRFLELQYTIRYAAAPPLAFCGEADEKKKLDFPVFYQTIKGLLSEKEQNMLEQLLQMQNTMKNVREMMQMMELMKELNPDMFNPGPGSGTEPDGRAEGSTAGQNCGSEGGRTADGAAASGPGGEPRSENDGGSFFGGMNPMDLLKGMLTPEQAAMFEMFQKGEGV